MDSTDKHDFANLACRRDLTLRGRTLRTLIVKELRFVVADAKLRELVHYSLWETHFYH